MVMQACRCVVLLCCACALTACAFNSRGEHSSSVVDSRAGAQDSVINLRSSAPPDSVLLYRGQASILLSMRDVEAYFSEWPLPPDMARLRDEVRNQYLATGWARLGEGMLEDLLAARLIEEGKAAIRWGSRSELLARAQLGISSEVMGTTVVSHTSFYGPDDTLFLRVLRSIVVS